MAGLAIALIHVFAACDISRIILRVEKRSEQEADESHAQGDLSADNTFREMACITASYQTVEEVRQRRSRFAQRLYIRDGVPVASSLTAALLDGLFAQPAGAAGAVRDLLRPLYFPGSTIFSTPS